MYPMLLPSKKHLYADIAISLALYSLIAINWHLCDCSSLGGLKFTSPRLGAAVAIIDGCLPLVGLTCLFKLGEFFLKTISAIGVLCWLPVALLTAYGQTAVLISDRDSHAQVLETKNIDGFTKSVTYRIHSAQKHPDDSEEWIESTILPGMIWCKKLSSTRIFDPTDKFIPR